MRVKVEDDCETAADVRARAARVREFQKKMRTAPPAPPPPRARAVPVLMAPRPERAEPCWTLKAAIDAGVGGGTIQPHSVTVGFGIDHSLTMNSRAPMFGEILIAVARHTGVSAIDIKSSRRTENVVGPRQLVMALARRLTLLSMPQIGSKLGNRDHTTVLHALAKYSAILDGVADRVGAGATLTEWVTEGWKEVEAYNAARKETHRLGRPRKVAA